MEGTSLSQMAELVSINVLKKEQIKTMQMIKQGVIHLREPSLVGKHYRIVKEYCFVGVVTPPYLIEHANLHSKTQKAIRIKLCLVVLICISQHESPCMGKTKTKLSLRHFLQTKSISLNCY